MGQVSLFMLNKQGVYQKWYDVGDSSQNYSKFYTQNMFLKKVIVLLLRNKSSLSWHLLTRQYKDYLLTKINLNDYNNSIIYFSHLIKKKLISKNLFVLFGNFWVLRYQQWLIVNIYFYRPYGFKHYEIIHEEEFDQYELKLFTLKLLKILLINVHNKALQFDNINTF